MRILHFSKRCINLSSSIILGLNSFSLNKTSLGSNVLFRKPLEGTDFSLLTMKRNESINFGGQYSFPGGKIDEIDFEKSIWEKFFDPKSLSDYDSLQNFSSEFSFQDENKYFPSFCGFRITAIRELLEECGLLLIPSRESSIFCDAILVNKNDKNVPLHFIYNKYRQRPPIERLYPWSQWLTPDHIETKFKTIFYFAGIHSVINVSEKEWQIDGEAEKILITCSTSHLGRLHDKSSIYPPPQMYELQRLANYQNLQDLLIFSIQRTDLGISLLHPKKIQCSNSDKAVFVLNGDEFYDNLEVDSIQSLLDFDDDWHFVNRTILENYKNFPDFWWVSNTPIDGHSLPIARENIIYDLKNTHNIIQ